MKYHLEIDYSQFFKHGQHVPGDVFFSKRIPSDHRYVSTLADGLGSGIKANVLATLTTTMATRFVESEMDLIKAAEVIMETLPICSQRKIGYSTFTILDINDEGEVRIIEHDNPEFLLIRDVAIHPVEKERIALKRVNDRPAYMLFSQFLLQPEDRIVFFSDGVTQAGIGKKTTPLGWGMRSLQEFIVHKLQQKQDISARDLSRLIIEQALAHDNQKAGDDITCGVIYFRKPRKTLLVTGPPYDAHKDSELAEMVAHFDGKRILAGGTTANIIARELKRSIKVHLEDMKKQGSIPPTASMEGIDLITEGTITLSQVKNLLEQDMPQTNQPGDPAVKLVNMLLNSDVIDIITGTRINEAHQDPNLPQELEIRRNLMKKIREILEVKYLKQTSLLFL